MKKRYRKLEKMGAEAGEDEVQDCCSRRHI